ncbi:MAG: SEL1-like repeat protein [Candidatus Riflebacteria bacterium]|nr:SEL1-like repeat protein [Candidatus Riflebacteria bacterium]
MKPDIYFRIFLQITRKCQRHTESEINRSYIYKRFSGCFLTLILIFWLLLSTSVSGAEESTNMKSSNIADHLKVATELAKNNDWAGAKAEVLKLLAVDRENARAWFALGMCEVRLGSIQGAVEAEKELARLKSPSQEKLTASINASLSPGRKRELGMLPDNLSSIPGVSTASDSNSAMSKPSSDNSSGAFPNDESSICQTQCKIITGAIEMYFMDNPLKGSLPEDLVPRCLESKLLKKEPCCPKNGAFILTQEGSKISISCSVHGGNPIICTELIANLPSTSTPKEVGRYLSVPSAAISQKKGSGNKNLNETYASLLPLAEGGDLVAQTKLGLLCRGGRKGAPKDPGKAREWLEKAAKANHTPAMFQLGQLLSSTDKSEANIWLEKAVKNGFGQAAFFLGNLAALDQKKEDALNWYRKGTELGHAPSMCRLAKNLLAQTPLGNPEIEELFRKAAEKGYPQAMSRYGEYLLLKGQAELHPKAWCWATMGIERAESIDKEDFQKIRDSEMSLTVPAETRIEGEKLAKELLLTIPVWNDE